MANNYHFFNTKIQLFFTGEPVIEPVSVAETVMMISSGGGEEKEPVPLVDYVLNVMKFVDAILSNNSTDDHCREFVNQKGLGKNNKSFFPSIAWLRCCGYASCARMQRPSFGHENQRFRENQPNTLIFNPNHAQRPYFQLVLKR